MPIGPPHSHPACRLVGAAPGAAFQPPPVSLHEMRESLLGPVPTPRGRTHSGRQSRLSARSLSGTPPEQCRAFGQKRDRLRGMSARTALLFTLAALPLSAAAVQTVKPEEIGLSSERLQRIHEAVARHIDAHDISGAVTVVARKGRLAHFEAHGLMDVDSNKAMSKDSMFWIASMSKPITGVAILMLMEEGKVRLTDPVSKFIPEFR